MEIDPFSSQNKKKPQAGFFFPALTKISDLILSSFRLISIWALCSNKKNQKQKIAFNKNAGGIFTFCPKVRFCRNSTLSLRKVCFLCAHHLLKKPIATKSKKKKNFFSSPRDNLVKKQVETHNIFPYKSSGRLGILRK